MRRYLMCRPTYFAVDYAINPWMDPATPVDVDLAIAQWERLADLKAGPTASRRTLPSVESYPSLDAPTTTRSGPVATVSDADVRTVRAATNDSKVAALLLAAAILLVAAGLLLERAGIDPGADLGNRRRDHS